MRRCWGPNASLQILGTRATLSLSRSSQTSVLLQRCLDLPAKALIAELMLSELPIAKTTAVRILRGRHGEDKMVKILLRGLFSPRRATPISDILLNWRPKPMTD